MSRAWGDRSGEPRASCADGPCGMSMGVLQTATSHASRRAGRSCDPRWDRAAIGYRESCHRLRLAVHALRSLRSSCESAWSLQNASSLRSISRPLEVSRGNARDRSQAARFRRVARVEGEPCPAQRLHLKGRALDQEQGCNFVRTQHSVLQGLGHARRQRVSRILVSRPCKTAASLVGEGHGEFCHR